MFSEKGFSDSMKATFTSATTWTAEGTGVNYKAPCETLSSSPFSQLPEVHFTLFPLFLKATCESDFYFLNIPSVLSLIKLILPGKNIHEIMTIWTQGKNIEWMLSCFGIPTPPKNKIK